MVYNKLFKPNVQYGHSSSIIKNVSFLHLWKEDTKEMGKVHIKKIANI